MNLTLCPAQVGFVPEVSAMATAGTTVEVTVIIIPVDVSGEPVTQDKDEVIIQVTVFPSFKAVLE